MNSIGDREAAITHMAESEEWIAALKAHVHEIVEGEAFKGSNRCGKFLTYIVDQAIAGHFDSLKERVIGLELFERSPAYDTSEDAIVRVTASDVRKRLLQHYGKYGAASDFRINLPLGSYVPEILRTPRNEAAQADSHKNLHVVQGPTAATAAAHREPLLPDPLPMEGSSGDAVGAEVVTGLSTRHNWSRGLLVVAVMAAVNFAVWAGLWKRVPRAETAAALPSPWSALFTSPHPTHLITSDPDIAGIQILRGSRISVSDYANRNYLPDGDKVPADVKHFIETMLLGDKAATIDAQIAANIAEVARMASKSIEVQGARSLQFSNLKTDDNFIFLGSPSSDPWFSVFSDQLDFRIVQSHNPGGEMIADVHPSAGEQSSYVPTARGGATGESYAIVAFIGNPDQYGQVMLLAGANREGTLAAGKLVTDLPRLSAGLQKCGLQPSSAPHHFELLLHLKTMADYPDQFDVVACHLLPGGPAAH
jgi:hypothetical protein